MKRFWLMLFHLLFVPGAISVFAGEASTKFHMYVPPNNDCVNRNVCMIVTAIQDSTEVTIIDDGADGDTDDSWSGILNKGESYIVYIKDGAVNDDRCGDGTVTRDGDYFKVTANAPVLLSQSTDSDWQHDWVPSDNKTNRGNLFFIYAPKTSWSPRDLNVFAYEDSTSISIYDISTSSLTSTGKTSVDPDNGTVIVQGMLQEGEDIIYTFTGGKDALTSGRTYMVKSTKPITCQYGALHKNTRDGGGFVPGENGYTSAKKFYFTIPAQRNGEQELRLVSFGDANNVTLEVNDGGWTTLQTWTLDRFEHGDWVVPRSRTYNNVFRLTSSEPVSLFEANWLETGSYGTSDVASFTSSEQGYGAGTDFVVYMGPPGKEGNIYDPLEQRFFSEIGGFVTHLLIYGNVNNTTVTVKDTDTDGSLYNQTFTLNSESYIDVAVIPSLYEQMRSDGKRPYMTVTANNPVAVFASNWNDNWMTYANSILLPTIGSQSSVDNSRTTGNDTLTVTSTVSNDVSETLNGISTQLEVDNGLRVLWAYCFFSNGDTAAVGSIVTDPTTGVTAITFPDYSLTSGDSIYIESGVTVDGTYNDGTPLPDETVLGVVTSSEATTSGGDYIETQTSSGIVYDAGEPATGTSSGATGGLESNSDLAQLIAQRLYRQLQGETPAKNEAFSSSAKSFNQRYSLANLTMRDLVPESGPLGSTPMETTPDDLVSTTNADSVLAVDFVDGNGENVATVFITATTGEVYDHTKGICDRVSGSSIDNLAAQSVTADGNTGYFYSATIKNDANGTTDQSVLFTAFTTPSGDIEIQSNWLGRDYQVKPEYQQTFNFQVWSSEMPTSLGLVEQILSRLNSFGNVTILNNTPPQLPESYVLNVSYSGTKALLEVRNNGAATNATFSGEIRTAQDDATVDSISIETFIPAGESEIELDIGVVMDAFLYFDDGRSGTDDAVFITTGAFGYFTDASSGGSTVISDFNTAGFTSAAQLQYREDALPIAGGVSLEGDLDDFAGAFRTLISSSRTAVDLRNFDYMIVNVAGSGVSNARIRLETSDVTDFDYFHVEVPVSNEPQTFALFFEEFRREYSPLDVFDGSNVQSISFIVSEESKTGGPFSLTVDQISFNSDTAPIEPGDLDSDESITVADAQHLLSYLVSGDPFNNLNQPQLPYDPSPWRTDRLLIGDTYLVPGKDELRATDAAFILRAADDTYDQRLPEFGDSLALRGNFKIALNKTSMFVNDTVLYTIELEQDADVYGVEITISFDSETLEWVSAVSSEFTRDAQLAFNTDEDEVRIALATPDALQNGGTLATLKFVAKGDNTVPNPGFEDVYVNNSKLAGRDLTSSSRVPESFELGNNFPNPFNPETTIPYALPFDSRVTLTIYNVLGQEVATLVNRPQSAGFYQISWDGRMQTGQNAASGIYFYSVKAEALENSSSFRSVQKMILIR